MYTLTGIYLHAWSIRHGYGRGKISENVHVNDRDRSYLVSDCGDGCCHGRDYAGRPHNDRDYSGWKNVRGCVSDRVNDRDGESESVREWVNAKRQRNLAGPNRLLRDSCHT